MLGAEFRTTKTLTRRNNMCSRVTCSKCGKPTWTGCGQHVEQALAGVPVEARCKCR